MRRAVHDVGYALMTDAASCCGCAATGVPTPVAAADADGWVRGRSGWVRVGRRGRDTGLLTRLERLVRSVSAHRSGG